MRDMVRAEFGRRVLSLGEHGVLGLLTCGEEFGLVQQFRVLNTDVSLHMTILTDVLVETLQVLSATVRWATHTFFSPQDHAVADIAMAGIVTDSDWNRGTFPKYWRCGEQRHPLPGSDGG